VKLDAQDDFESLKAKITTPTFVSICLSSKCKVCNHHLSKTLMTIVEAACYKCKELMKVAVIEAGMSRDATYVGPEPFTSEEIEFAREKGVIIEQHFSKTVQESYLANTCLSCKAFVGQHYLFTDYLSLAGLGDLKSETYDAGYYCEHCSMSY